MSNFFYENSKTRQRLPLDIYLGNLGPLMSRVYEAAPPGPLTTITPFVPAEQSGQVLDSTNGGPAGQPPRYMHSPLHTIGVVELPSLQDVVAALQESPRLQNQTPSGETDGHNDKAKQEDDASPDGTRFLH